MFQFRICIVPIGLAVLCFGRANAEDNAPIDILRLPAAKLENTATRTEDDSVAKSLTGVDRPPVVKIQVAGGAVDLVYGFGGELVTAERLIVTLPPQPPDAAAERVEMLVSITSPVTGFNLVRSDPLKPSGPQEFSFAPIGTVAHVAFYARGQGEVRGACQRRGPRS